MNYIVSIIASLLIIISEIFKKDKRKEEVAIIKDKQQEVDFQSQVEEIVKSAESKDENEKNAALHNVRILISE